VQYDNGTTISYTYDQAGNRLSQQVIAPPISAPVPVSLAPSPPLTPEVVIPVTPLVSPAPAPSPTIVVRELDAYAFKISGLGSREEVEQLRDEIDALIENSDLSPADKNSYREQLTRELAAKIESLLPNPAAAGEQTEKVGSNGAREPAAAPDLSGKSQRKNKIIQEKSRIYTTSPKQEPEKSGP
jgi:hypothetical protein